jgi:NAD(P)-dependent dehydrogenase (short-subunit alcohol dehydrogenase family)
MNANVLQTDLTGKVAVVTGAGGILCGHMAKALARAGAKVALVNRSEEAINQYAAEIRVEGGIAKAYKGNVLVKADMENIANRVLEDFGPCDILINGAGGNNPRQRRIRNIMKKATWIGKM